MSLLIEKNIPIPKLPNFIDDMKKLELGDSFLITDIEINGSLRAKLQFTAKKLNIKITQKTEGNGLRVWRME